MSSIDLAAAIQAAPIGSVGIVIDDTGHCSSASVKLREIPAFYIPALTPGDRAYIIPPDALAQYEVTQPAAPGADMQVTPAEVQHG